MRLPSTRQLLAFVQVARFKSFRRAAEALHLSQPALSHAISQLEQQLEVQLLDRTTRSVQLTAAGRVLLTRLDRVLADLAVAISDTEAAAMAAQAVVRIGFIYSATRLFLPNALTRFKAAHPSVKVVATDATPDQLCAAVLEGKLDFAITSPTQMPSRDLSFKRLVVDDFRAVLRSDHPLASRDQVTWGDLLTYDFIAPAGGSAIRNAVNQGFAPFFADFRPSMEVAQLMTVNNLVEAGLGVTALPQLACPEGHGVLRSLPLIEPVVRREVGLVTRRNAPQTRGALDFRSFIETETAIYLQRAEAGR